jgi:hypothetical protein
VARRYRYCTEQVIFACRYCVAGTRDGFALLNPKGKTKKTYKDEDKARKRADTLAGRCFEGMQNKVEKNTQGPVARPKGLKGIFQGSDIGPFRWGSGRDN